MAEQFEEIIDNLDEVVVEEKPKEELVVEVKEEKNTKQEPASIRFRLFIILLCFAVILLGFIITQIVFLSLPN